MQSAVQYSFKVINHRPNTAEKGSEEGERMGPARAVICTRHLGEDVRDVCSKETKVRAKLRETGSRRARAL